MSLYPLKFAPIVKEKIWGGQKLKTVLNKDLGNLNNGGESWELSSVPGDVSVVANGALEGSTLTELLARFKGELMGEQVYARFGDMFPLLIKFIDANDDLSVQVHPDDAMASVRHNSFGKTEMWYVMAADQGAKLISGFSKTIDKSDYKPLLEQGKFLDVLAQHEVKPGDVLFMPAGRIHAIGKGVLVAEIQQTSDVTYRVYDYDRRDDAGKTRDLHVDEAQDAIHFNDSDSGIVSYKIIAGDAVNLVNCPYFCTSVVGVDGEVNRDLPGADSFHIYMCVEGSCEISTSGGSVSMSMGETVLIPASLKQATIKSTVPAKLLEVYVP
ncbi:MAG: type I phosphomannose isomerase catalytic subunit [Breznakibacter sp.]